MSPKSLVWLGVGVGGTIGGLVPMLWGAGAFSFWGVLFSGLGGFAGLYLSYKYLL